MKTLYIYRFLILLGFVLSIVACVEEIDFETETLLSILVVEATITDVEKQHTIKLSRSYEFEADGPIPERNASVRLESSNGEIVFIESEPGIYMAGNAFRAESGIEYTLHITTSEGKKYVSAAEALTGNNDIGELYIERETDDLGNDGVSVLVDSYDPSGNSQFYRFEYEETYKVIAPLWRLEDLVVIDPTYPECSVELVNKEIEQRTCFATDTSKVLILGNTSGLTEDRLERFIVRRIRSDNYILTHRYSILVRQFIQSRAAHTYFNTLKEFSESESIFSQNQPGYFDGNIVAEANTDEPVAGFFEVSHVSEQRVFFSWEELFGNENRPPYISPCFEFAPVRNQGHPTDACGPLITSLLNDEVVYTRPNPTGGGQFEGEYFVAAKVCGHCTALGSNVVPDFWIEE